MRETIPRVCSTVPERVEVANEYLTTTATRWCLDRLTSARDSRAACPGPWLASPVLSADLVLGPEERAAFVPREAFDCRRE